MSYLENDICNLKLIENSKLSKNKINILSTAFFKMDKHYKNFNIYLNGLKKWIKFLNSFNHDYTLRLFIDNNVYNDREIMKLIRSTNKIQPILFSCNNYKKDNYHIDLFATLVRFFPYFNFKNNDSKNVIVVDLDLHDEDYRRCKYLMENNLDTFTGMGNIEHYFYKHKSIYMIAATMSNPHKFDKDIIINFIENAHNIKDTGFYNKRFKPFGFGVDEIFINKYLLSNIDKYASIIEYNISYFMYHSKQRIMKSKNSEIIFKYILGKYYKKGMSVYDMYKFIDKQTYQITRWNESADYLSKRFYKIISYLHKKNIKWLERNIIDLTYKYLNNLIYAFLIITTNGNSKEFNKLLDINLGDPIYVK